MPFVGFWLEAPDSALLDRVSIDAMIRRDADATVIRMQRSQDTGAIEWRRLDASPPPAAVLSSATACLSVRTGHDEQLLMGRQHDGPTSE